MYRFTMPDPRLGIRRQKEELIEQYRQFLASDAIREIYKILGVDHETIRSRYDNRKMSGGRIVETQVMERAKSLDHD